MTKEQELRLSDRELAVIQSYADENGLTIEEAATQLIKNAIAKRFRKSLGRGPAKVYSLPRRNS